MRTTFQSRNRETFDFNAAAEQSGSSATINRFQSRNRETFDFNCN